MTNVVDSIEMNDHINHLLAEKSRLFKNGIGKTGLAVLSSSVSGSRILLSGLMLAYSSPLQMSDVNIFLGCLWGSSFYISVI